MLGSHCLQTEKATFCCRSCRSIFSEQINMKCRANITSSEKCNLTTIDSSKILYLPSLSILSVSTWASVDTLAFQISASISSIGQQVSLCVQQTSGSQYTITPSSTIEPPELFSSSTAEHQRNPMIQYHITPIGSMLLAIVITRAWGKSVMLNKLPWGRRENRAMENFSEFCVQCFLSWKFP